MKGRRASQLLLLLLIFVGVASAQPSNVRILNKGQEGQRVVIDDYLSRGKLNLVQFTSRNCPACRALAPKLEALVQKESGLVLNLLQIDRPEATTTDWQSPLARQYELRSVPFFKLYDGSGKLLADGEAARKLVAKMLIDSGVI